MADKWKIFAVLAAMFTVGFFYRVSMAVVSKDLVADLGLSAAQLGVVSGTYFYAFGLMQLPLGPLIDRFGGRVMICLLGVVTICGSLLFSLAGSYPAAVAARALLGCGTACVLMGSLKIIAGTFPARQFPHLSGLMIAIGNLGSVCATAPLAWAVTFCGWRNVFLAMTLVQVLATVAVFRYTREGDRLILAEKVPVPPSTHPGIRSDLFFAWKTLVRSRDFWLVALIAYFWYANYMVLLSLWGGPYLMDAVGLTRSRTGVLLLCISLGFVTGSLLIGKVIDWHDGALEKTIVRGQGALLLLMLVVLGPAEHLTSYLLGAVFFLIGVVSASGTIIYPLARNLVPHRHAATAMTAVNFFLLMGAATMQHLMGQVIYAFPRGSHGYPAAAYHAAFAIPAAGLALTLVLFRVAKGMRGVAASESVAVNS